MAVDTYTYGSVASVERIVGDIVDGRKFGSTTVPSLAQVEAGLDEAASMMHLALAAAGYPVDLAATVLSDAPRAHAFLATVNSVGGAAIALDYAPAEAVVPQGEEIGQTRSQRLWARFNRGIKALEGEGLDALGLTKGSTVADKLVVGSYLNSDGKKKLPLFKRGGLDFPNTRDLTETV